jgi:hypothetical protein
MPHSSKSPGQTAKDMMILCLAYKSSKGGCEANDEQILAHGPGDRLYHARQAVLVAQQGVKDLGDDFIGEKIVEVLAEAEQTLQDVLDSGTATEERVEGA